jgi:hypothetical protein
MQPSEPRRASRGLPEGRPRPTYLFDELYPEAMEPGQLEAVQLQNLRDRAKGFGYNSFFDLALVEANVGSSKAKREFVETGGFAEFCRHFQAYMPKPEPSESTEEEAVPRKKKQKKEPIFVDANNDACNTARDIYFQEFEALRSDSTFRAKMINITNETISSVDLSEYYYRMKAKAPCLFALLETLYPEQEEELDKGNDKSNASDLTSETYPPSNDAENDLCIGNVLTLSKRQLREQRLVMAMFVLGGYTGQRFNLLHGLIGNYLWQYNAPTKVINTLFHLGVSASYSGLRKIWHERAKENLPQTSVVENSPITPKEASMARAPIQPSITNFPPELRQSPTVTITSNNGLIIGTPRPIPNPLLMARNPFQKLQIDNNKRNAEEPLDTDTQSISGAVKKRFVDRRPTWKETPKVPPPELRQKPTSRLANPLIDSTKISASNMPIPSPNIALSKKRENGTSITTQTGALSVVQTGAATISTAAQQGLNKMTISGEHPLNVGRIHSDREILEFLLRSVEVELDMGKMCRSLWQC